VFFLPIACVLGVSTPPQLSELFDDASQFLEGAG